jgi:hypothetical protein
MQFLLCEGEVEGPAEGNSIAGLQKSVYLDETPIQVGSSVVPKPDDLVFSWGRPSATQTGVPGFSQVSTPFGVDTEVRDGLPVAQSVTAPEPNAPYRARVLLTFSGLVRQTSKGDVLGTYVALTISYTDVNDVKRTPFSGRIEGKFSGQFQREFEFALQGEGPWRFTVSRDTVDDSGRNSSTNTYRTAFNFSTVILSLDQRFSYPHSSMLSLGIRADQYSSLPRVSVEMKGLILDVPSNYDPVARTYTGTWDGTFKRAYSNNPAWVLRDIIVHDRYGLGAYVSADQVDKWTLYSIAQYCDQSVPAPGGGTEPRFTCNLVLQTSEQAWNVLQQLSSIFRGLLYYAAGSIISIQDRPGAFVYTFNESNTLEEFDETGKVSQGNFTYSGSAQRARHTAVLASWDDPSDNYQPRVEYIADEEGIARFGYKAMDLRLFGVTSRGQALRAANWALLSEALLTDTVTFRTNEIGSAVRPGDLIKVADPTKAARRYGGRIKAVVGDVITLDDAPAIPTAGWAGSTFSYMTADAAGEPVLTERQIASLSADTVTLVANASAPVPTATFPWLIESPDRTAQPFRVLTVEEQDDGVYAFTALRYREDLYNKVDFDTPLEDNQDYLYKTVTPGAPTISTCQIIWDNNQAKIDTAWEPSDTNATLNGFDLTVKEYRFQYQAGSLQDDGSILYDDVWREIARQNDNREQIGIDQYVSTDRFRVRICAVSRLGVESDWVEAAADPIEVWFPMPDIGAVNPDTGFGNAELDHFNQSTGSQLFNWVINVPVPPYVNGVELSAKPSRDLTPQEAAGLDAPDTDGYYFITIGDVSDYYGIAFHATVNWTVRMNLVTTIPGLTGQTFRTDTVDVLELYPPSVENFRVVVEGGAQSRVNPKRFSWNVKSNTPFLDKWPLGYVSDIVQYRVRYRYGTVPDWDNAFELFSDGIPGNQTWFETNLFDYGTWVVMIKPVDATGWESELYALVTVNIGDPLPTNVVERVDYRDLGFPGELTNFQRVSVGGALMYPDPQTDAMYQLPYDDEFYEGIVGSVLRQIDATETSYWVVGGAVAYDQAQLIIYTQADATYRWFVRRVEGDEDLMYPPPQTDEFYGGFDQGNIVTGAGDAIVTQSVDNIFAVYPGGNAGYMYISDNTDADAGWHPYAPNEVLTAGYFELRLEMKSLDGVTRGQLSDADVVLDYPDVYFTANDVSVASSATRINFPAETFRVLKTVTMTVQDNSFAPGVAVNAVVTDKQSTYVEVQTIDAAGNPVAGILDLLAVGY